MQELQVDSKETSNELLYQAMEEKGWDYCILRKQSIIKYIEEQPSAYTILPNQLSRELFFDWNRPGSETEEGYVTFRFAGDEARSYEDYKITKKDLEEELGESFDEEVGEFESLRLLNVTTFKAAR